jgi:O-antigen/teichoic acid export membrane protein
MRPTVMIEKMARAAVQLVAVLIVGLAGGSPTALAIAFTAPYLPALAWAIAWRVRITRREGAGAPQGAVSPTTELRHEFWSYTRPRSVARICQVALQRADVVLVAYYLGLKQAAVYGAASRLLVFGQLGVQAVQQVIQPHLSRLLARDDRVGAERVFRASTAWLMAFGWPAYLVSAVAAPLMLSVFRHDYSSGSTALVILSITMLIATACGPVDIVLLMAGRSGLSLFNNAAALVVDVAVDIVLIPRIGITGAAVGWAAALVVRNVLPLGQVLRVIGMSPFSRGVAWVAATSAFCFGALPLLQRAVFGTGLALSLAWLAACTALYGALLWYGRDSVDLDAFRGLVNRRRDSRSVAATAR